MKRSVLLALLLFSFVACGDDDAAPAGGGGTSSSGSPSQDGGPTGMDAGTDGAVSVTPGGGGGALDPSFKNPGGDVSAMALMADGKIAIGGAPTSTRAQMLNADGTPASGFAVLPAEVNNLVAAIAPLPDGKIVIGGNFNSPGFARIGRLGIDGKRDATFNVGGNGAEGSVSALLRGSDGKIVVAGYLTGYNKTGRRRIARINEDGTLDTSFDPKGGAEPLVGPYIHALALQSDGKVIAGGTFESFDGKARKNLVRLNPNGSVDESFNAGDPGTAGDVSAIVVQPDGKVLVGGGFTKWNGVATNANYLVRLNADGTLDETFRSPFALEEGVLHSVTCLALQNDGKVFAGGYFGGANVPDRINLARFNADGSLDASFKGPDNELRTLAVRALALQPDGKLLVAGDGGVLRLN